MKRQEIVTYLEALGVELEQRGFDRIDIMVVGGVYMVINIANRPATEDIDFQFLAPALDLTMLPLSDAEKSFRSAVKGVAKAFKLKQSWLNDDAAPFTRESVVNPEKVYWRSFSILNVFFPNLETMLVYKLVGYSQKQNADIAALCKELNIRSYSDAKRLVDRLVSKKTQKDFGVEDTLDALFE